LRGAGDREKTTEYFKRKKTSNLWGSRERTNAGSGQGEDTKKGWIGPRCTRKERGTGSKEAAAQPGRDQPLKSAGREGRIGSRRYLGKKKTRGGGRKRGYQKSKNEIQPTNHPRTDQP